MSEVNKAISENLRAAMQKSGMTDREIGELAGLHRGYVTNVRNGCKLPSYDTLYALAGVLGVQPADLLPDPLEV